MFKLGRGGGQGRGNGKRSHPPAPLPPPQNLHRPGGRLSVGPSASSSSASRNRAPVGGPGGASAASASSREETFSLESGGPLKFAAIIRLTPDLVEEVRRVEAQGGDVRIKFDPYSNHDSENVVDVGGKEFKFTWSKDTGDLCDIYEERQNGEDGNGSLVECGSSWRKLTVQRILDESTKHHVKMRSEEAERLSKSRKAIILDPANPSVKNQAKSMVAAAVEGNMRRGWKHKEFFKKRKLESEQVSNVIPTKSYAKSGTSSNNATKARSSASPLASPLELHVPGTSASPFGVISSSKGDPEHDGPIPMLNLNKDVTSNLEKETQRGIKLDISGDAVVDDFRMEDLQNILISILSENPKGISLKDLEKAADESIPDSSRKVESIIRNIATYRAPGRYFLKPEVEVGNFKQPALESGSSPESDDHTSMTETHFQKTSNDILGKQSHSILKLEEADQFGKNKKIHDSQDPVSGEMKINSESEDRARSSSESGSDSESESESSDSESDSGSQSRSKSRSPAGSGSASSSDSDSDGSSSNKEGSDVDVDIMTSDDEKELVVNKAEAVEYKLSPSNQWSKYDGEHEENDPERIHEVQITSPQLDLNDFETCDGMNHVAEATKSFPLSTSSVVLGNTEIETIRVGELEPLQTDSSYGKNLTNDVNEPVQNSSFSNKQRKLKDGSSEDLPDFNKRVSKSKSKRASSSDHFQKKPEGTKRAKFGSSGQLVSFEKGKEAASLEKVHQATPNRLDQKWSNMISDISLQECRTGMYENVAASGDSSRMQHSPEFQSGAGPDTEHSGQRIIDPNGRKKASRNMDKFSRSTESFEGTNTNGASSFVHRDEFDVSATQNIDMQDKYATPKNGLQRDMRYENTHEAEKYFPEKVRDISGGMFSSVPDSRKSGESYGIPNGQPSDKRKSDVRSSSVSAGKMNVLKRELSDLELGEFRESTDEKHVGIKRQAESKGSLKLQETGVAASNNLDLGISKARAAGTAPQELKSPSSSRGAGVGINDASFRRTPAGRLHDAAQPAEYQPKIMLSQNKQTSRINLDSHSILYEKSAEVSARHETRSRQEMFLENHTGFNKKGSASVLQNHDCRFNGQMGHNNAKEYDNKNGSQSDCNNVKESKIRKSHAPRDVTDPTKNNALMVNDSNDRKTRDSSSDEDNFLYSKYDKGEPDLKGSIKDLLQYKEYVQEYHEKYEAYCSLNNNLEKIRNDFLKVGNDLEQAKGRNMEEYYKIVKRLREMYQQFGERNKQMKKVFILLHEELKNLKQRIKDFADAYSNE